MELNVHREPDRAKTLFAEWLPRFGDSAKFILRYTDFLITQGDSENAMSILRASLDRVKEEEKGSIWEQMLHVKARFDVCRPIKEMLDLESEYSEKVPSERNASFLSSIDRYTLWGVGVVGRDDVQKSFDSPEDRGSLKRRYPFEKKIEEEEDDSAAQEAESILSTLPQNEDDADSRVKTPEWMCKYIRKWPAVGMKQARNEHVMSVIRVLKNVSIPEPNRLLVSTHSVVCLQKLGQGTSNLLGPLSWVRRFPHYTTIIYRIR